MAAEARIMEYVRARGYPAPAVDELSDDGLDLVMERIEGVDMVATMSKRPWTIGRQGRVLAQLHDRLHALEAPDWLRDAPVGTGDRVLHLDLHPLNVIVGPHGPVVIDWTNASTGDPAVDVALTWVLMAAGSVSTKGLISLLLGRARAALVRSFLRSSDVETARRLLRDVVGWKVTDPHMSAEEQEQMWRVVEEQESPSA
jgi:aminoglycoside phosphotransferase (APT) family kinase protein